MAYRSLRTLSDALVYNLTCNILQWGHSHEKCEKTKQSKNICLGSTFQVGKKLLCTGQQKPWISPNEAAGPGSSTDLNIRIELSCIFSKNPLRAWRTSAKLKKNPDEKVQIDLMASVRKTVLPLNRISAILADVQFFPPFMPNRYLLIVRVTWPVQA